MVNNISPMSRRSVLFLVPRVPGENHPLAASMSEYTNQFVQNEQFYTYIMARPSCLSWVYIDEYDHTCWTPWQRQTLNTLFLIYFLWYYNIYIDGFNKVGFYHSIYTLLSSSHQHDGLTQVCYYHLNMVSWYHGMTLHCELVL
jgi:hypothetical protein